MAWPAWGSAAISGGSGILGPLIQGNLQAKANEHAWNKARDQYKQELADQDHRWFLQNQYDENMWAQENTYNEKMWHMMNDYNSPANQMARFTQAGLNPNLIYGQSNTTTPVSTASFNSKPFGKAGSPSSYSNKISDLGDLGGSAFVNALNQSKLTDAQIANTNANTALTAANTQNVGVQTETNKQNLQNIKDYAAKQLDANVKYTVATTHNANSAESRAAELHPHAVEMAEQAVTKIKGENANITERNALELAEIQLKNMGVYPGDQIYVRLVGMILQKLGVIDQISDVFDFLKK